MSKQKSFQAQVDAWCRETEERIDAVFKLATQELFYGTLKPVGEGGRMRVDTGFLRGGFTASLDNPVLESRSRPDSEGTYSLDVGAISLTIASANIGQTVYGMFTANYARPREYGSRGKPGDGFVMTNAAQWQDYVDEAALVVRNGR